MDVGAGNRTRLVGLDKVPTAELTRVQEDASAARPVAPMNCKNPRRFMNNSHSLRHL